MYVTEKGQYCSIEGSQNGLQKKCTYHIGPRVPCSRSQGLNSALNVFLERALRSRLGKAGLKAHRNSPRGGPLMLSTMPDARYSIV